MTDLIHNFFTVNRVAVLFVYGQVFFILGMVTACQSWQNSRLALARSLKWLAIFGFSHALYEWGNIFIPLQATYLTGPLKDGLLGLQLMLLAISFAALFQFGSEILRPLSPYGRLLHHLPKVVLVIWGVIIFSLTFVAGNPEWHNWSIILARYLIGFPAGLLSAYALRRHAHHLITPLEIPYIWRTLQLGGLALVGYGVTAGLIVPAANLFPASWLNETNIQLLTLIPVQVYRSLFGLILTVAILRSLGVFRVELDRRLSSMEEEQVQTTERERIGRELHDGTLQTIYAAGLLLRNTERELTQAGLTTSLTRLQQSVKLLDQAVSDIRGYIGVLRAPSDQQSLAAGLRSLATASYLRSLVEIELVMNLPENHSLEQSHIDHLLAIANEGLINVARHARASHVSVAALATNDRLRLKIKDNGQGISPEYVSGYGLRNMRDRARILGGDLTLDSEPGRGTTIIIDVPWREENKDVKNFDRRRS